MDGIMQVVLRLVDLTQNLGQIGKGFLIAALVTGLLNGFLGYKLLRLWVTVVGLIVGGVGGLYVGYRILDLDMILIVILAGAAALVLAAAAFYIYKGGIFLLCAAIGLAVGIYVIHPRSSLSFFICLMIAAGVGVLGVAFVKPIVIVTTSIQGGLAAGVALAHLLELNQPAYEAMLGIGITALGLVFQIFTNLRKEEDEEDDEDDGDDGPDEDLGRHGRREPGTRSQEQREKRDRIEQW